MDARLLTVPNARAHAAPLAAHFATTRSTTPAHAPLLKSLRPQLPNKGGTIVGGRRGRAKGAPLPGPSRRRRDSDPRPHLPVLGERPRPPLGTSAKETGAAAGPFKKVSSRRAVAPTTAAALRRR